MVQIIATKRTTLYRMLDGSTLDTAFTEARRESDAHFDVTDFTIEACDARLVAGSIATTAKWATDLKLLTGQTVSLSNHSPGAALLIRDSADLVWALTWGTGFHFLDREQVDFGFGSRIVARAALPAEVKSLTKTVLDHRARVDRSSMPNGSTIRDLGVDGYGEVVSRIEAKAVISGLSVGDRIIQLRAADSLNLPLAKVPDRLLADLGALESLSAKSVVPGLESLEQLIALKPQESRVPALDDRLLAALTSDDASRLGVSPVRAVSPDTCCILMILLFPVVSHPLCASKKNQRLEATSLEHASSRPHRSPSGLPRRSTSDKSRPRDERNLHVSGRHRDSARRICLYLVQSRCRCAHPPTGSPSIDHGGRR